MSMPDVETIRGYYMSGSWNDMMLRTAKVCKAITEEEFEAMRAEKEASKDEKAAAKSTKTAAKTAKKASTAKKATTKKSFAKDAATTV